jgi:multiple sugar transport system substrate-binding protein
VPLKTDIQHAALPKGPAGQFSMHTYFSHALPSYSKNQKAAKDVLKYMQVAGRLGRTPGFAGPANAKSAEVLSKYVITDMYAKAVQGMSAEEAVKWAEGEIKKVYS